MVYIFIVFATIIAYAFFRGSLLAYDFYAKFASIPSAPGRSLIFGHLIQMCFISWRENCSPVQAFALFVRRCSKSLNDRNNDGVYKIYLGPLPVAIISSPETAEAVFKRTNSKNEGHHQSLICNAGGLPLAIIGKGLPSIVFDGDKFKYRKRIISPCMQHHNVLDRVNKHFHRFTEVIGEDGILGDLFETSCSLIDAIASETITRIPKFLEEQTRRFQHLQVVIDFIISGNTKPWLYMNSLRRFFQEGRQFLHYKENDVFQEILEDAIEKYDTEDGDGIIEDAHPTLLNLLIREHLRNPFLLNREDVVGELKLFSIASFDSLSLAMTTLLHEVGHRPDIQDEIFTELNDLIPEEGLSLKDLEKLPYLKAVVKEGLRKNPPPPINIKGAAEDIEICKTGRRGFMTIPKGALIMMDILAVNNNCRHWKDPEEFNPNRFLNEKHLQSEHPHSNITFSGGTRACPGKKIAFLTLQSVLAKVVQKYTFKSKNPLGSIRTKYQGLHFPIEPVTLSFVKRK